MSLFLKLFDTTSEYEEARQNLILPNVSLTVDNNTVHYNPSTPSHDFVEIGGVKWATMNVGANSITDTGLYFQWGDTQGYTASQVGSGEGQKYFRQDDYIYYNDGSYTKYNETDGKTVLDASDDAVIANWGGSWRTPTKDEYVALGNAVNTAWTADYQGSGVAGMICTDKTDSSKVLFFPACGNAFDGSVNGVGDYGNCWSSSLFGSNVQLANNLRFADGSVYWQFISDRYFGFPVRGVVD